MSNRPGTLYVVATPIGNLGDISERALGVLRDVQVIAAEDTRHSARLLQNYRILTPMVPLHEHNERRASKALLGRLRHGESVALISDAGTPLVSDPGRWLVSQAHLAGLPVSPVPGPSALTAALSVSGLPCESFVFEGFLPSARGARRRRLNELADEHRTMVFFEAPHRILAMLTDMVEAFGGDRQGVLAREVSKRFETVRAGELRTLLGEVQTEPEQRRGELVLSVAGAGRVDSRHMTSEAERTLEVLLEVLPASTAAALTARLTGVTRRVIYGRARRLKAEGE